MAIPPRDPDSVARLLQRRVAEGPLRLPVSGTSMAGVIQSDSTVVIEGAADARAGEIWAMVTDDSEVMVHRIRSVSGDTVVARGSGNPLDDDALGISRLIGRVRLAEAPTGQQKRFGELDRLRAAATFRLKSFVRRLLA